MTHICKTLFITLVTFSLGASLLNGDTLPKYTYETAEVENERMEWWNEAKYGMFIHWGLYATPARGEWVMIDEKIPVAEYATLAENFNPVKFDAKEWINVAKEAGMKYIVVTSKHHDGFAMYDSEVSPYNIVDATPYKKDPLKALSEECKKAGIKFGIYYSQAYDWYHPGGAIPRGGAWDDAQKGNFETYFREFSMPQIKELVENYDPSVIWFDMPKNMSDVYSEDMMTLVRGIKPGMIVNSRLKFSGPKTSQLNKNDRLLLRKLGVDYLTYRDREIPRNPVWRDWETCMTLNHSWGFTKGDEDWKSPRTIVEMLMRVANSDGNFLLNFGPTDEGVLPAPAVDAVKGAGQWLKVNGEALYGARGSVLKGVDQKPDYEKNGRMITPEPIVYWLATERLATEDSPAKIYISIFDWPKESLQIKGLSASIAKAYPLSQPDSSVGVKQEGDVVTLSLPKDPLDDIATVICLELN